jgi:hypothetical protein
MQVQVPGRCDGRCQDRLLLNWYETCIKVCTVSARCNRRLWRGNMVKRMMVVVATVIALLACGLLPSQEANPAAPQLAPTQLTCPATVCPTCPAPPTATNTPQVTSTPTLTRTPTLTLTPTPIPWQYIKQANSPLYMQNFAHTAEGCNWLGIAGQVFTTSGKTINNIVVNVSGTLNGKALDLLGMSGTSRAS